MAAYGLYTHIQSNKRRSIALLIGLFFLVYLLTYAGALVAEVFLSPGGEYTTVTMYMQQAWADLVQAAPYVTGGTVLWIVIAYFFHQSMIDAVTDAQTVTRAEQPRLYNILENLCISRGIPMPKLKIADTDALNAFATGMNQRQYAITVTSGLVKTLSNAELEAVLGHELTHIRNGDVQMLVVAVVIAGVVSFVGELVFRILFNSNWSFGGGGGGGSSSSSSSGSSDKKGGGGAFIIILIALVLVAIAWLLALVIRLALSRTRETLADAGSVELTKDPDALISALRKIDGHGELPGATSAVMEMCIDNPREEFADLFATHPSIDKRIKALMQFAGGHDDGPHVTERETDPQLSDVLKGKALPGDHPGQAPLPGPWTQPAPDTGARDDSAASTPPDLPPTTTGPWGTSRG